MPALIFNLFAIAVLLLPAASSSFAGISDGLIAYYPMEGNASDASGNGNNGTNRTGTVQYAPGIRGLAAWFDGQSCIQLPQPRLLDGASNATLSAWVWFSGSEGGQIIGTGDARPGRDPLTTRISPSGAEDTRFQQVINDEQTLLGFDNGESIAGLAIGAWRLFTMVLSEGKFQCYVNTVLVKQSVNPAFLRIAYDADMPALIGAIEADTPYQFWRGGIDELRIYNRALSKEEVAELYFLRDPQLRIEVSQVRICWNSLTNQTSQVQYRSELTGNTWTNLGAAFTGKATDFCVTDDVSEPRRFYRLIFPQ